MWTAPAAVLVVPLLLASCATTTGGGSSSTASTPAVTAVSQQSTIGLGLRASDLPAGWVPQPDSSSAHVDYGSLAHCMHATDPWAASPVAAPRPNVFHDPTDHAVVGVRTQVESSVSNATARLAATANPLFPTCLRRSFAEFLKDDGGLIGQASGATLEPVGVQVTQNPSSSDVSSATVTVLIIVRDPAGAPVANMALNDLELQKGRVLSELSLMVVADPTTGGITDPADLLQRLDDTLTTRISEHVTDPQEDGTPTGYQIPIVSAPDDPYDYVVGEETCTVEKGGTEAVGRGSFDGAELAPLPTLPLTTTYNMGLTVWGPNDTILGVFVSNEQPDYVNAGRRWVVAGKLPRGSHPTSCWYQIGTYDLQPLSPLVTPPAPTPTALN